MANKKTGSVADVVTSLATPLAEQLGYSIWDVEYVREGADYYLRITIDSENGVGIDDCETVHRAIDPLLDEADPIEDTYYLDVSSPGLERDIRTKEHFLACAGEKVSVKLFAPINKRKEFIGILSTNEDASVITITESAGSYDFKFGDIAKANVYCEF